MDISQCIYMHTHRALLDCMRSSGYLDFLYPILIIMVTGMTMIELACVRKYVDVPGAALQYLVVYNVFVPS